MPARRAIVGVMGSSVCDTATYARAQRLGELLAQAGYVVLCGGGTGVMEAVARGARAQGGTTIGILPGRSAAESPPNPYIDLPLFTGIFYARNLMNVLSSDVVIAVAGGLGTLSEIALALKCGKPVVRLASWEFQIAGFERPEHLYEADTPEGAVERARALLAGGG
jgi:uncharacterized protein (TIGR00725 family)